MSLKNQLESVAERNKVRAAQRADKYFASMSSLASKIPSERITKFAIKALDAQQEATHRMLDWQAPLQNWSLRKRGSAESSN
jgi:hypothetical protein